MKSINSVKPEMAFSPDNPTGGNGAKVKQKVKVLPPYMCDKKDAYESDFVSDYPRELQPVLIDTLSNSVLANSNEHDFTDELKKAFVDYKVNLNFEQYHRGASFSRYEFSLPSGEKLKQILALRADLSLLLGRNVTIDHSVGKTIAVDVANEKADIISIKDALTHPSFKEQEGNLIALVGATVTRTPVFFDLSKQPHLLIGGCSGSGKSIYAHSLISSICARYSPSYVRFALVDFKSVEFGRYSQSPYLLNPQIIDSIKHAQMLLLNLKAEMNRRYSCLRATNTVNISSYNALVDEPQQQLPYIVLMLEEFADAYKDEVIMDNLFELVRKGRAAGIHVVLSTQRPSVDVLNGSLKANFPSRIAFKTASQIDSRVLLDKSGAELLFGNGDMLATLNADPYSNRLQGYYTTVNDSVNIAVDRKPL